MVTSRPHPPWAAAPPRVRKRAPPTFPPATTFSTVLPPLGAADPPQAACRPEIRDTGLPPALCDGSASESGSGDNFSDDELDDRTVGPLPPLAGPDEPVDAAGETTFGGFAKVKEIRDLLRDELFATKNVNFAELRRRFHHTRFGEPGAVDARPSSRLVREMYCPVMCNHGASEIPAADRQLRVDGWDAGHRVHCEDCRDGLQETCYYAGLRKTFTHGYLPAMVRDGWPEPVPLYSASGPDGNHPSVAAHFEFVRATVERLLAGGVIRRCDGSTPVHNSPLGVSVQRSRSEQVRVLTGITVTDDASYQRAVSLQAQLDPLLPKPKRRMIFDLKASGVNGLCRKREYRQGNIADAIELMYPGCIQGCTDFDSYYNAFSMAPEWTTYKGFVFAGVQYVYVRGSFGLGPLPQYTGTATAEISASLAAHGIPNVGAVDDFYHNAPDDRQMDEDEHTMRADATARGLVLNEAKRQRGTSVVFWGFTLDSTSMSASVSPDKARGLRLCLAAHMALLQCGGNVPYVGWRSMCGRLEDISQVCQEGKSRVHTSWDYLREGPQLDAAGRVSLLDDLAWWMAQLAVWGAGGPTGCEYPIVNGRMLAANPGMVEFLTTDMSGPDGVGGYHGRMDETDPRFFSAQWPEGAPASASFDGELRGLELFLQRECDAVAQSVVIPTESVTDSPRVLVWVTDSQSAARSVNSGRCSCPRGTVVLRSILRMCAADRPTVLLALWVAREFNHLADRLSHLAALLHRPVVEGRLSEIGALRPHLGGVVVTGGVPSRGGSAAAGYRLVQGGSGAVREVPSLPPGAGHVAAAPDLRGCGRLPGFVRAAPEDQEHPLADEGALPAADSAQGRPPVGVPLSRGREASDGADRLDEARGLHAGQPEGRPPVPPPRLGDGHLGSPLRGAPAGSREPHASPEHAAPDGRDHGGYPRQRLHLGCVGPLRVHPPAGHDQDLSGRGGDVDPSPREQSPPQRPHAAEAPLGHPPAGRQAERVPLLRHPGRHHPPAHLQSVAGGDAPQHQAGGDLHRPGRIQVLGPQPAGRWRDRHVRARAALLCHQADGQVALGRSPLLLPLRADGGQGGSVSVQRALDARTNNND